MKRILIATDGSAHALKAAQLAGELAASMGAELHVLTVAYRDREGERGQGEFAKIEDIGIADVGSESGENPCRAGAAASRDNRRHSNRDFGSGGRADRGNPRLHRHQKY